ncbi:sodium channel and clathrin linker 1 isoform X2 [Rhodamnia argentea]|uniref:Sodium channel and clathrin linker 1 isoform X2 n=1 Tax=Rhodamnia argentea TaxID=178133 RepID=A0A8B8NID1_9MYRT|nr:sodium channel and clathrin linker 1 isoform X2 [Rhodamnia argentea]
MEGKDGGQCKIRKRGCSSSSSSSLVRRYRLKRAILVGKRAGSSTPVPTWRTGAKSPPLMVPNACLAAQNGGGRVKKEVPVSARKLAATLWEINGVTSPGEGSDLDVTMDQKLSRRREKDARLSHSGSLVPRLSVPNHSPVLLQRKGQAGGGNHRRRGSAVSQKLLITDYIEGGQDSYSNASLIEIEATKGKNRAEDRRTRLKDVVSSLTTSKELLKVLFRVGGLEKQHKPTVALVSALGIELDRSIIQVEHLIHEERSHSHQIDFLMKHFAEEKASWRRKERERIRSAISHMAEEVDVEKKLRRQTERLNKKLGQELAGMKSSLSRAMKELESEKRAKEILEQVCDELASGIGEDRAQVEELKRESAKVLEEVEKEREMLQLADGLREERVQMKLSEAKYHFEEKNAAVEKLRAELEAYMRSKTSKDSSSPKSERAKELKAFPSNKINLECAENELFQEGKEEADGEECEGNESAESDLHSIELNMDNNTRSYKWSYAHDDNSQENSKRVSVDNEFNFNGRRSSSDKIQWESISLRRGNSKGANLHEGSRTHDKLNGFDAGRLVEFFSQAKTDSNKEDETRRNRALTGLKDHQLLNFASPIRPWSHQSLPLQHHSMESRTAGTSDECEIEARNP